MATKTKPNKTVCDALTDAAEQKTEQSKQENIAKLFFSLPKVLNGAPLIARIYWAVKAFFTVMPLEKIGYVVVEAPMPQVPSYAPHNYPNGTIPTNMFMAGKGDPMAMLNQYDKPKVVMVDRVLVMRVVNHIITSCQEECKQEPMIELCTDQNTAIVRIAQNGIMLEINCERLFINVVPIEKE